MGQMGIVFLVAFGLVFYRTAAYERMAGWAWAMASVGLSLIVMQLFSGLLPLVGAQLILFALLWRQHMKRQAEIAAHRLAEHEARERQREKLLRRGREEAARDRVHRDAVETGTGEADTASNERMG